MAVERLMLKLDLHLRTVGTFLFCTTDPPLGYARLLNDVIARPRGKLYLLGDGTLVTQLRYVALYDLPVRAPTAPDRLLLVDSAKELLTGVKLLHEYLRAPT
jgi:hypothetical protein